jgi:hypothetical protein
MSGTLIKGDTMATLSELKAQQPNSSMSLQTSTSLGAVPIPASSKVTPPHNLHLGIIVPVIIAVIVVCLLLGNFLLIKRNLLADGMMRLYAASTLVFVCLLVGLNIYMTQNINQMSIAIRDVAQEQHDLENNVDSVKGDGGYSNNLWDINNKLNDLSQDVDQTKKAVFSLN